MKVAAVLIILGIIVILLFAFMTCLFSFNPTFKSYVINNWHRILIDILLFALASWITIFSVNLTLTENTKKTNLLQVELAKTNFAMIMAECSQTLSDIRSLRQSIENNSFNCIELSNTSAINMLSKEMLYKYSCDEYWAALRYYISYVNKINKLADMMEPNGTDNVQKELLNKLLDETEYYTYLLQYQSQYYIFSYEVRTGPQPPNYKEIVGYLNKTNKITSEELKKKVDNLGELDKNKRSEMKKGLQKALERQNY